MKTYKNTEKNLNMQKNIINNFKFFLYFLKILKQKKGRRAKSI